MLADAGIPLGAQTVLLKGVNDDPEIMKRLVHQLLLARVKPYYLYQADLTKGTNHFRTTVETGLNIIKALQGHTSGMAVPHFVIDAPGGGGKIPLLPDDYLVHMDKDGALLRNYENKTFHYPQPKSDNRRELPMVGVGSSLENAEAAYVTCGDSYPDRDGYAAWGNSCGGDADDL
jgi:lysine 2,3-aminomutase